ncbi:hypothetical protein C4552_03900 [Candidatus Parcubacteria bacterium]|nr:MAG: hypothetical protein C4552_03900 [Candidatus Parcubacteria bacterium]
MFLLIMQVNGIWEVAECPTQAVVEKTYRAWEDKVRQSYPNAKLIAYSYYCPSRQRLGVPGAPYVSSIEPEAASIAA